jgi:uncharacterized repeat protein (TIGR01451 family)
VKSGAASQTQTTVTYTVGALSLTHSGLVSSKSKLIANGASIGTITVVSRDGFDNIRVSNADALVLATSGGTLGTVTDNHDGTYTASLTSGTVRGTAKVSGTINGQALKDTASVTLSGLTLVFDAVIDSTVVDAAITPAVVARVKDDDSIVDTTYAGSVTLSLATKPTNATLAGTLTKNAIKGVATYSDLTIDTPGTGYSLRATETGTIVTTGTSGTFKGTMSSVDLALTMVASKLTPAEGDTLTLTVTAKNNTAARAFGVAVTVPISARLQFVSASTANGTFASGTGIWTVGTIASSGTAQLVITVIVVKTP